MIERLDTRAEVEAAVAQYAGQFVCGANPDNVMQVSGQHYLFAQEGYQDCRKHIFQKIHEAPPSYVHPLTEEDMKSLSIEDQDTVRDAHALLKALRFAIHTVSQQNPNLQAQASAGTQKVPGAWAQPFFAAIVDAGSRFWISLEAARRQRVIDREAKARADAFEAELRGRGIHPDQLNRAAEGFRPAVGGVSIPSAIPGRG